jgi:hypothetical protein
MREHDEAESLTSHDDRDAVPAIEERLRRIPLSSVPEPEQLWTAIATRLDSETGTRGSLTPARQRRVPGWLAAAAVMLALLGGAGAGSIWSFRAPGAWPVATERQVAEGVAAHAESSFVAAGDWLVTDSASTARLRVGRIGVADIGPSSRLRVERGGFFRHRMSLERGRMSAVIEAPPRLFFVRAPSALATDLGCAFTLEVDEDGSSRLEVTEGWVELSEMGRRSLVPAGMAAAAPIGSPPGTPYPVDFTDSARAALDRIDEGVALGSDLHLVLASLAGAAAPHPQRQLAATTMWHLLQRTGSTDRAEVYDRLASLSPPPARVTREGILSLDRRMLERWRSDLHPMWSEEAQPLGTRLARQLWDLVIR